MKKKLLSFSEIRSFEGFKEMALNTFKFQHAHNQTYRSYCDLLNKNPAHVKTLKDLPFLPIQFFKSHRVVSFENEATLTFRSSGTTSKNQSRHHLANLDNYHQSFNQAFQRFYGSPKKWVILGLLPSYLEREGSSLIYMMNSLIEQSQHASSGFYLHDFDALQKQLYELEKKRIATLLLGVSFALLDFASAHPISLSSTIVMETGGMKGRRKEITREAVHQRLISAFGCSQIHSEYGMTELLSQAYSKKGGRFECPPWMQVVAQEINDPFCPCPNGKVGRLNIIDLANQDSCAFIATEDLGKVHEDGSFEVLGRLDQSDLRGCNLLVF